MGKIQFLKGTEEIDSGQWDALASESVLSTFFQTKDCYEFYAGLSFLEAFVFAVTVDDKLKGVIVGYIQKDGGRLKQFFSRRAIINGGPLLADDVSDEVVVALLGGCRQQLKHKTIYIETRNFNDYSQYKNAFDKASLAYEPHYNFHVDTSSLEVVEQNMGKSRKRDVKTSLRDGAEVVENPTEKEVSEFYGLLDNLYRTRVKTPLFPLEFFNHLYYSPFGRFLLVRYENHIIGGTVCVEQPGRAVYEWFACGEDGMYKNIYPSTVSTHAAICYAASHGCPRFDMMGAGAPGDGGYGVRDFKAKFGGQLVEHGRNKYVCNDILYAIGLMGVKILRRRCGR